MYTIKEICDQTGLSKRTLQYYDRIGLLKPTNYTEAGYRLYDETSLERLQQILLYRELEFPLKEIRRIVESSDFDRNAALEQQIELLTMKKEHLENLIAFATGLRGLGINFLLRGIGMDFSVFNTGKIDEYAKQAREKWSQTAEYKEFEAKQKDRTPQDERRMADELMARFGTLGQLKHLSPDDSQVQEAVHQIRMYICEHFYQCSYQVFAALGRMYAGGGSLTENIDAYAGKGTAEFAAQAVEVYCASAEK